MKIELFFAEKIRIINKRFFRTASFDDKSFAKDLLQDSNKIHVRYFFLLLRRNIAALYLSAETDFA